MTKLCKTCNNSKIILGNGMLKQTCPDCCELIYDNEDKEINFDSSKIDKRFKIYRQAVKNIKNKYPNLSNKQINDIICDEMKKLEQND